MVFTFTSILDDNENNSKSIGLKYIILRLKEMRLK